MQRFKGTEFSFELLLFFTFTIVDMHNRRDAQQCVYATYIHKENRQKGMKHFYMFHPFF